MHSPLPLRLTVGGQSYELCFREVSGGSSLEPESTKSLTMGNGALS